MADECLGVRASRWRRASSRKHHRSVRPRPAVGADRSSSTSISPETAVVVIPLTTTRLGPHDPRTWPRRGFPQPRPSFRRPFDVLLAGRRARPISRHPANRRAQSRLERSGAPGGRLVTRRRRRRPGSAWVFLLPAAEGRARVPSPPESGASREETRWALYRSWVGWPLGTTGPRTAGSGALGLDQYRVAALYPARTQVASAREGVDRQRPRRYAPFGGVGRRRADHRSPRPRRPHRAREELTEFTTEERETEASEAGACRGRASRVRLPSRPQTQAALVSVAVCVCGLGAVPRAVGDRRPGWPWLPRLP